jgi:hypothetical protein
MTELELAVALCIGYVRKLAQTAKRSRSKRTR